MNKIYTPTLLIAFIAFVFYHTIQFSTQNLAGVDAYFHIKFSYLMREHGLIKELPWLQYTIHKEYFRDHHFLYHIFYIPFTFGNLLTGAKWGAVFFPTLTAVAFYRLLKVSQLKYAFAWTLLMLVCSRMFIYRMSMARVQSISLLFLILGILFIIKERHIALSILAFCFVWLYDGFFMLGVIGVIFFLSKAALEKKYDLKMLFYLFLGLTLGLIINPYFPNNITSLFFNMIRSVRISDNVDVGGEWYPFTTWSLVKDSAPVCIMFLGAIFYGLIYGIKDKAKTIPFLLISLFFLAMLCKSRRSIEYWPPFCVIFSAFALDGFFKDKEKLKPFVIKGGRMVIIVFVIITTVAFSSINFIKAKEWIMEEEPFDYFKGAAVWLKENTNQGDIVFNADWDDFPQLFFYNSENYYIFGLDANYIYKLDKELYFKWRDISFGDSPNPSTDILNTFKSKFVVVDNAQEDFIKQAEADKNFKIAYKDANCSVYEIINSMQYDIPEW